MDDHSINFISIQSDSVIPVTAKNGLGFELYCSAPTVVPAQRDATVSTGIKVCLPRGYAGKVIYNSAFYQLTKLHLITDYINDRREIVVTFFNPSSSENVLIEPKTHIANLLCEHIYMFPIATHSPLPNPKIDAVRRRLDFDETRYKPYK